MSEFRAGFVAIVGEPNAGKSTLTNNLVGEKVSIVTAKPQTTRQRVTGILANENVQIMFVDAPGVLESGTGLNAFLMEEAQAVIASADVLMPVFPVDESVESVEKKLTSLKETGKPLLVVVSKADLLGGGAIPEFVPLFLREKVNWIKVSSQKDPEGTRERIIEALTPLLPPSDGPLFEEDLYTTQTLRQMAAEMIREKCFEILRQEVPYGLAVRILSFKEDEGPVVKIHAELMLDKENHKRIVIGTGGQTLKTIGMRARKEIENLMGRQVYLDLHVIVRKGWMKNKRMMKELGYVVSE